MAKRKLVPEPTLAQKVAYLIGRKSGPNTIFRYEGKLNADITIKYNTGVYVGKLPYTFGLMSKSIGLITWKDIPSVLIGRFSYRAWRKRH
jgi:hypothetical protein